MNMVGALWYHCDHKIPFLGLRGRTPTSHQHHFEMWIETIHNILYLHVLIENSALRRSFSEPSL